jgi:hypothetical protein
MFSGVEKIFIMAKTVFAVLEIMFSAGEIVIFLVPTTIGVPQKRFSEAEPIF